MAFVTYPLNNIEYQAEDAELFHCTRTSGIWAQDSFPTTVTGADNNVTIGTGIAWINNEAFSGKVAAMKAAETLDLGIADSVYPRIDVVAIQFSVNANATSIVVKKGSPASSPVRPAIARTGSIYELYLCEILRPAGATTITSANVTDLRLDPTVCGLMADSVTEIDTAAINSQVVQLITSLRAKIEEAESGLGVMLKSTYDPDGNGIISTVNGGTGIQAESAEELLYELGGQRKVLLWENASPSSVFADQTITIDGVSDYDVAIVIFNASYSVHRALPAIIINLNTTSAKSGVISHYTHVAAGNNNHTRRVTINTDDTVVFHEDTDTNYNLMIPVCIYGIKQKTFIPTITVTS